MTQFASRLARHGLSSPAFFVPGRIEVLGKHTDYGGGRSLLCAMERGILISFAPRSDVLVRVTDLARQETRELKIDPALEVPRGDWANYVAAVVRRIARDFPDARQGVEIRFASDLPAASGMSSSSALVIAIFLALDAVNGIANSAPYRAMIDSREALAAYLAAAENGLPFGNQPGDVGVGTFGGSEDHTAILCCRAEHLSRYSFRPTRSEGDIPFPADKTFAIAFTGIAAEKAGPALAAYNEASLAVRRILELWNRATGRGDQSLAGAIESEPDASEQICRLLGNATEPDFTSRRLRERFDHFILESQELVPRASAVFARGDYSAFGELVKASQESAESLLHNQIPETIALVKQARHEGAHAASAFGAGFGGSVWALVDTADAEGFLTRWSAAYERAFPEPAARSAFFLTRPGPGARPV